MRKAISLQATEVDPYLLDILRDGLTRYHRILGVIPVNTYPEKYRILIQQQNDIGWAHLYTGRWSREWILLQNQYTPNQGQSLICGEDWIVKVGRLLIDQWYKVWNMRNEERHHRDNQQIQEHRQVLLHNELHRLYSLKNQMLPCDRHLLHDTAETHLQRHAALDQLEEWIAMYRPVIQESIAQAHQQGLTNNTRITDFPTFNPSRTPPEQASLTAALPGG